MYVAILMNTFVAQCDPYGIFNSENDAWDWIRTKGDELADNALWSVHEVIQIDAAYSHVDNPPRA